ncbi:AAA family ATPase [Streptomyces sp. NPDC006627]|uniref:helix-turn-helix transcriptional regulator n=1 Tax=Streptomyces sp. NPDC006627 TaxID=3154679 RepID=UPI0033B23B6B
MRGGPVAGGERGAEDLAGRGEQLAGRDEQLAAIDAALAGITAAGTSVLLRGDPGMGKTALLKVAETKARNAGLRVLRMTGAEAEAGLPFAALHQVLWPLLDDTQALSAEQRDALESALGVREGMPPEGFTVAGAALTLLAHAAARRPVGVLLDDLQWADPSSVAVFGYLRRHLASLPVVLVGAIRHAGHPSGDVHTPEGNGDAESLPGRVIDLEPLDERQAKRLLRTLHPWLPDTAHRRVLRAAGGNPLALRELPAQIRRAAPDHPALLAARATADGTEPFDELPLGTRLGSLYEDSLRALPDSTRHMLLVAAVGGSFAQRVSALRNMARDGATTPWTEIHRRIDASGLARVDLMRDLVLFHHPLVRACLVHIASPAERRAAHRLLARSLPAASPQRITHLAAATVGTDARLAELLHAQADGMAAQGGDAEAAGMMARAAGLSPDPATRAARLVAASGMAARGGRLRLAVELLAGAEAEARPEKPEPAAPYAFALAYTRLQLDGDPTPALELLPGALELPASPEGREHRAGLLEPMLFMLIVVAVHTGDERAWAAVDRHAGDATEPAALCRRAWAGPSPDQGAAGARAGAAPAVDPDDVPQRLREAVAVLPADRETPAAWLLLWAAAAIDAVGEHAALASPFVRHHAFATQAFIESLRAHDDFLHGRWDASLATARDGAKTSAAHGYAFNEMLFLQNAGQVLAARGDGEALAALEPVLGQAARERNMLRVAERLHGLRALCALGHGRAEDAWDHARSLTAPGVIPPRSAWFHLSLVDWIQAAVDSGHRPDALRHLRAVRAAGTARASAHHAFLVAVAEALAGEDGADQPFEAVYAFPGAERWLFPLARARLAHGARLRRRGLYGPAAARCRAALDTFIRLGTAPWAAQAARELDAMRAESEPPDGTPPSHPLLSAQESRIAELAAQGLTNRQIGERLGLSPRTIGAHLFKVFPKLGITTRAGIARALEESRAGGAQGGPRDASQPSGSALASAAREEIPSLGKIR